MTRFARRSAAVVAGSILLLSSACAADRSQTSPTISPAGRASAPVVTPEPGHARVPEGTYRTPKLTAAELVTAGKKTGLTPAQVKQVMADEGIRETVAYALKVESGQWTQFYSYDGGAQGIGFRATYELVDDDTVVTTEECCGRTTFGYILDGDSLRISWVSDDLIADRQACLDDDGCLGGLVVWESAPFRRA